MAQNIIGASICALAGFIVAFLNYVLSRKILETRPERFAFATVIRQIVQVGYLIAVYFIGTKFTDSLIFMLVGAVSGITISMFFFTKRLLVFNENLSEKKKEGEGDENG